MVERFDLDEGGFLGERGRMEPSADGDYVRHSDYADLERQIAELRAELNANPRWKPKAEELAVKLVAAEAENARLQNEWDNCDEMLQAARAENARLREANKKLHRRAQWAEGLLQNASNIAREQIETLESVATKAGHWPAGSHWAKRAMERWLESVLSGSTQPALPLKDEVERVLERCTNLLDAAGKAIEEDGWDMDFSHVDGISTDHIGFSTDCDNAVSNARAILSRLRAGEQEGNYEHDTNKLRSAEIGRQALSSNGRGAE